MTETETGWTNTQTNTCKALNSHSDWDWMHPYKWDWNLPKKKIKLNSTVTETETGWTNTQTNTCKTLNSHSDWDWMHPYKWDWNLPNTFSCLASLLPASIGCTFLWWCDAFYFEISINKTRVQRRWRPWLFFLSHFSRLYCLHEVAFTITIPLQYFTKCKKRLNIYYF